MSHRICAIEKAIRPLFQVTNIDFGKPPRPSPEKSISGQPAFTQKFPPTMWYNPPNYLSNLDLFHAFILIATAPGVHGFEV